MRYAFALAVVSLSLLPAGAFAQTAATPLQQDLLMELLAEVRGLRQSMERAATVGARIQLLVARVQLQEQRIAELSRRLIAVRDEVTTLDAQSSGIRMQLKMFEKSAGSNSVPAEERSELEQMLENFKTQVANSDKRRQDLMNEESMLLQQISADQNRWSDVNSQLDDLERTLAVPAKKP
jgi:DNA repair exonuclease SbcCD ATPase subunit